MQERKIKSILLKSLLESNVISLKNLDVYEYGLEISKLYTFVFLIVFICSCIMNTKIETMLFSFNFLIIRAYSGGLHLNNKYLCLFFSIAFLSLFPMIFKYCSFFNSITSLTIFLITLIIIKKCCPIESKNKRVDSFQYKLCKKKSYFALIIIAIEFSLLNLLNCSIYTNIIIGSLFINCMNILLGYYIHIVSTIKRR